ncbi:hypothetical protein SAMN05421819_2000 [Bryocella elongata]|uniref:Uncharacterized protein n=1 Tax=Bryocella elongata TaxID=863522 RepID=A0A1H5XXB4_9BACT|nr:hypothetical protein [Bryocella elongata]SEG15926.1 hypothetical protein SAMN05421819_2000 [Bryocella elongata]
MDFEPTLHKIDAEIAKLQLIRDIVQRLESPSPLPKVKRTKKTPAPAEAKPLALAPPLVVAPAPIAAKPEPSVVVLPPRIRREYHPRAKHAAVDQRALAPARSDRPVFVSRANMQAAVVSVPKQVIPDQQSLEALVRSNLLGSPVHAAR